MADDSVVVKKSRSENAGNRREDKTGTTPGRVRGDDVRPKARIGLSYFTLENKQR